jgi:hypothetical protein
MGFSPQSTGFIPSDRHPQADQVFHRVALKGLQ